MKDKFNWVYLVFALVCMAFMLVSLYKGMYDESWKMFLCLEICLYHIKLNEIEWRLEHEKRR